MPLNQFIVNDVKSTTEGTQNKIMITNDKLELEEIVSWSTVRRNLTNNRFLFPSVINWRFWDTR
jgi:hypothetical protein